MDSSHACVTTDRNVSITAAKVNQALQLTHLDQLHASLR
jgi:hypothetical protein